jgi:chitinase
MKKLCFYLLPMLFIVSAGFAGDMENSAEVNSANADDGIEMKLSDLDGEFSSTQIKLDLTNCPEEKMEAFLALEEQLKEAALFLDASNGRMVASLGGAEVNFSLQATNEERTIMQSESGQVIELKVIEMNGSPVLKFKEDESHCLYYVVHLARKD